MDDGSIIEPICDCPYDLGPVCKHIAAACFYLRQQLLESDKPVAKEKRIFPKPAKRKTKADQIDELLEKVTHENLKQFALENTEKDRSFRDSFLLSFAENDPKETKAIYTKRIKAILRSVSDRHGFIEWHASGRISSGMLPMLDAAEKHVSRENYLPAVHIVAAIAEEVTKALQYADDSNGSLGDLIYYAFEILFNIANSAIPEAVRIHLIDYCFTAFDKKLYEGWDWHMQMLQIASILLKNETELQKLLTRTNSSRRSDFEIEEAETITFNALLKVQGEKAAADYLKRHLANSKLRRIAIEDALNKKQYDLARVYALDGIDLNRKSKPGLVVEWNDWLFRIALAQKDRDETIKYARWLFIDGFRDEREYYTTLKNYIPAETWTTYVDELVSDVMAKSRGYTTGRVANIYILEGWFGRLFELIKNSPSLSELERYEPYLKKDYASEIALLYGEAIIRYASENVGRQHYQTIARYLRRIKKLGSPEMTLEVIEKLRSDYPQRRALQEELDLV